MKLQLIAPCLHAGIIPHISAVAPVLTEFDIIAVRCARLSKNRDQLMLRAIKASHSARHLVPDAEIDQVSELGFASLNNVAYVSPIHAHKGSRSLA